ncbi:MAG: hypothetical protein GY703_07200 [Gammaproteobacteria bacterium]|nr:hypothetical protein [Gammaproteobacteria bacterium]
MTRNRRSGTRTEWIAFTTVLLLTLTLVCYHQFSLFVLAPEESFEGATLLIKRIDNGEFLDSAKGMCERLQRDQVLICKTSLLANLARKRSLLQFPYSKLIHEMANRGLDFSDMMEHTHSQSEHGSRRSRDS